MRPALMLGIWALASSLCLGVASLNFPTVGFEPSGQWFGVASSELGSANPIGPPLKSILAPYEIAVWFPRCLV